MALRGPSAVAVHDDRQVRGQPTKIDLSGEALLGGPGRNDRQDVFKSHAEAKPSY
jgi:hypothetical protein